MECWCLPLKEYDIWEKQSSDFLRDINFEKNVNNSKLTEQEMAWFPASRFY